MGKPRQGATTSLYPSEQDSIIGIELQISLFNLSILLVNRTILLIGNGKEIEVKDVMAKFTMDVIGSTAFGLDVNSFKDLNAAFVKYGKMIFNYNIIRGFEILSIFFLPSIMRFARIKVFGKKPTVFFRNVFWETLTQRMKSGGKRNDLIDILIELKQNYSNQSFDDFSKYKYRKQICLS